MPSLRCCCCQAPPPLPRPAPPLPPSTDCFWFPPPLVPPSPASMTTSYHAPTIQFHLEFPHVTAKSIICSLFGIVLVALVLWCCKKKKSNNAACDAGDERPAQPIDPELFEDALCGAAGALSCSGCG